MAAVLAFPNILCWTCVQILPSHVKEIRSAATSEGADYPVKKWPRGKNLFMIVEGAGF